MVSKSLGQGAEHSHTVLTLHHSFPLSQDTYSIKEEHVCTLAKILLANLNFLRGLASFSSRFSLQSFGFLLPAPIHVCVRGRKGVVDSDWRVRDLEAENMGRTLEVKKMGRGRGSPTFCLVVIHQGTGGSQGHCAELGVPPSCIHRVESEPVVQQEKRAQGCDFRAKSPGSCKEERRSDGGRNSGMIQLQEE